MSTIVSQQGALQLSTLGFDIAVEILTWIENLVVDDLGHEVIKPSAEGGTEKWADPKDPVLLIESTLNYGWAESAGRIERGTGEWDGDKMEDGNGETDNERGYWGCSVLLNGKLYRGRHS